MALDSYLKHAFYWQTRARRCERAQNTLSSSLFVFNKNSFIIMDDEVNVDVCMIN